MNNFKEKIVFPAWQLIRDDGNIKKYYLIPWLLSIIFFTWLLVYQVIYTYVKIIWNNQDKVLKTILRFLESDYWWEVLLLAIIFLISYFILGPIFEWGLIKYLDFKEKGKALSKSEAFWQGLYKFLPLFEYNNIFSEFKLLSLLNFYLFTIRFVGIDYFKLVSIIFIILIIPSIILNILFSYAKYFIVIENKTVFASIGESTKLAILNFKKTIKIFFLLFILNLRVIINFIIFLFFPIIIVSSLIYISSKFLLFITIWVLLIIFLWLIIFVGYLTAVLEVFKVSLWYNAYIEWKKMLDE